MQQGATPLTDKQRAKIFELRQQGIEPKYIAERFGMSRGHVNNVYSQEKKKGCKQLT